MTEGPETSDPDGEDTSRRYALDREDDRAWVIRERAHASRGGRVVARITMTEDDDVHVVWLGATPLPVFYANPQDALESLEGWQQRPRGGTKPVPIPHFPPPTRFRH